MTRPGRGAVVVALGTTRRPKVAAARRALGLLGERFPDFLPGEPSLAARSVPSGVSDTPASVAEMMRGARHRAEEAWKALVAEGEAPALALGLEGGIARRDGVLFLESWAFARGAAGGSFGSSGAIQLPEALAGEIARGVGLGEAADRYFDRRDVAGHEGTFGQLSAGVVTREEAFVRALLHALAPFYNAGAYQEV